MKKNIHPKYNSNITAKCACGNSFTTGSTREKLKVEICSACHPFFTGKQKLVDTARRVEKFESKIKKTKTLTGKIKRTKKEKNAERKAKQIDKKVEKTEKPKVKKAVKKTASKDGKKADKK